MKRLVLALIPLAVLVSGCAVGQVTSIDDVGPLGADVHGTAASNQPSSLELMLIAKQGGTPTPDDNDDRQSDRPEPLVSRGQWVFRR